MQRVDSGCGCAMENWGIAIGALIVSASSLVLAAIGIRKKAKESDLEIVRVQVEANENTITQLRYDKEECRQLVKDLNETITHLHSTIRELQGRLQLCEEHRSKLMMRILQVESDST